MTDDLHNSSCLLPCQMQHDTTLPLVFRPQFNMFKDTPGQASTPVQCVDSCTSSQIIATSFTSCRIVSFQFFLAFQLSALLCPVATVEPVSEVYLHLSSRHVSNHPSLLSLAVEHIIINVSLVRTTIQTILALRLLY